VCLIDVIDIRPQYNEELKLDMITRAHGFVLVYSVTDKESLEEVLTIQKQLQDTRGTSEFALVLVGTKTDESDDREVSKEEGEALAEQLNCPFFEASSKTGDNVDNVFLSLVDETRRMGLVKKEKPVASRTCATM